MKTIRTLLIHALFIALLVIVTLTLQIPFVSVGGYFNLSDTVIMLFILLDCPFHYFLGAGIGPMIADLLSPYAIYAPFTFAVKALLYIIVYLLYHFFKRNVFKKTIPFLVGGIFVAVGYGFVDFILTSDIQVGIASFISNLIQGITSSLLIIALMPFLEQLRNQLSRYER